MSRPIEERHPISDVITGKKTYGDFAAQPERIAGYHERVAAGKVFGEKTAKVLPGIEKSPLAIDKYFKRIRKEMRTLDSLYGLEALYGKKKLAAIQEEATRLMWVYGIETDMLHDLQRGLLLLGVAATLKDLENRGPNFKRERKRMHAAVRMIAQTYEGSHSSIVDKMVVDFSQKRDDMSRSDYQIGAAELKADFEAQFTFVPKAPVVNTYFAGGSEVKEKAHQHVDVAKTAAIKKNTEHLQRVLTRLGIQTIPDLDWLVTTLSPDKFHTIIEDAAAVIVGHTLIFPNNTESSGSKKNQQHELVHAVTTHSGTVSLGAGLAMEADAEMHTDAPMVYEDQRLLTYFAEDCINLATARPLGDQTIAMYRVKGAIGRANGHPNNPDETAWQQSLVDTFGLEGFLAYYMVHSGSNIFDIQVKDELLDYKDAISKFRWSAYHNFDAGPLKNDFYEPSESNSFLATFLEQWQEVKNIAFFAPLEYDTEDVVDDFTRVDSLALARRFDAFILSGGIQSGNFERKAKELKKIAWIKHGFSVMPDTYYDLPRNDALSETDRYVDRETLFHFPNKVGIIGDMCHTFIDPEEVTLLSGVPHPEDGPEDFTLTLLLGQRDGFVEPFKGEKSEAVYLSFVHTLSHALSKDIGLAPIHVTFGRKRKDRIEAQQVRPMTPGQRFYAEKMLAEHHRLMEEEEGDLTKVTKRMREEVLKVA